MMNRVITFFGWSSLAIVLCYMFCKVTRQFLMAGIWNFWYPMKYFTSWIFYVRKHVQYNTTYQVTIVTQFPYIVSLVNFGLLGNSFYIHQVYFCNLLSENATLMALLCSYYLLSHTITFIFYWVTGNVCNPL